MIRTNFYPQGESEASEYRVRPGVLIAGASVAVLVPVIWYWSDLNHRVQAAEAEWRSTKQKADAAAASLAAQQTEWNRTAPERAKREALLKYARTRVPIGPLLQDLYVQIPANVELTALSGQTWWNSGVMVTLSGAAAGEVPRLAADKFRLGMLAHLQTIDPEAKVDFAMLEDTSRKVGMGGNLVGVANFSITLRWRAHPLEQP